MTFATPADLQARFGERELRLIADRDDGAVYADVLAAALQDADAEIVGLIGAAVTIDAQNPPLNLKRLACDIARYRLYGSTPTEDVRLRYSDAVKFLRLVATGDASLDGGAVGPAEVAQPPLAAASDPGNRVFKRGLG